MCLKSNDLCKFQSTFSDMKQELGFIERMFQLPLFMLVFGMASVSMLIPAVYAGVVRELETGRAFLYSGVLGIIVFVLLAMAHNGRAPGHGALGPLMSLFSTFVVLPVILAIPFHEAVQTTTFFNAYVEMVSSITTTGATLFDDPTRLDRPLHLWRAQVGWMGGLIMWIAASAILAPLNLGGFEVTARAEPGRRAVGQGRVGQSEGRAKLIKVIGVLFPAYFGLTWLLWALLWVSGDESLVALCHAMSIMATSGISPVGGLTGESGLSGEMVMVLFMMFALSRLTFSTDTVTSESGGIRHDPEFRIGLALFIGVPIILFARHWVASFDVGGQSTLMEAGTAFWGAMFTVMSFLTTTGFTSVSWGEAQAWSGLATPGLILMGLCLVGGGVATTAGGVKLLRVFALYRNGKREMERLVHPSSVSGADPMAKRLQKNGAFIAWIFFMLFALSFATVTILLSGAGVVFEDAIVIAISGLSTTGPLLEVGGETPIRLIELSTFAKTIFTAAMVVGRLETLAIIALLTPDLWRG
jgi:trk system potassium uptake protein TrkH